MTSMFGRSYIAKPHMQPGWIGEPGKAPAWYFSTCFAATMVPSFLAPSFTSMVAPEVGPEARNTSSRVICIFTGRPVFFDSASASGSRYTSVLPPNPPPISAGVARMLEMSIPSSFAT